jgi:hypothetical protein
MGKYSRFDGKVAKGLNRKSSWLEGKVLEVCRESSQGLKGKYSRKTTQEMERIYHYKKSN